VLAIGLLLALAPSWLGLLGAWHWQLDLMAHFRWQYLIGSAVAMLFAMLLGRRVGIALALRRLLRNAVLIGRLAVGTAHPVEAATDAPPLRVLSFNVLTSNLRRQTVLEYLQQSGADVIVLLEVDDAWLSVLTPLQRSHPHHVARAAPDNFGIALFSRVPASAVKLLHLPGAREVSATATLAYQGRRVHVVGTHPVPPGSRALAQARDAQLDAVSAYAQQLGEPTIVVGDLNATPWSHGLRIATRRGLGFRSIDPPWTPTWQARTPVAVPIDHALCTAELVVTRREVGPDLGSDHRPMLFELRWAAGAAD